MKAHTGNVRSNSAAASGGGASAASDKKREYLYAQGPTGSLRTLLTRAMVRLDKQTTRAKSYGLPEELFIVSNLQVAVKAIREAITGLESVPRSWKPARGSIGGGKLIAEGSHVVLKEGHRKAHVELSNTASVMHVDRVIGSKIVCTVESGADRGIRVVVIRAHLEEVGA